MSKKTLINISTYSASIGLSLILCSYMILDIDIPWVKEISMYGKVFGFLLFGIFISITVYAYVAYRDERIKDGKPF